MAKKILIVGGGYAGFYTAWKLEKLLRAGAYMAEVAGDMSAEEWAHYEAAERAASPQATKEGGAA